MSNPNSPNPLFPNPTIMPNAYPPKDKLKAFNIINGKDGKNTLGPYPERKQKADTEIEMSFKHGRRK